MLTIEEFEALQDPDVKILSELTGEDVIKAECEAVTFTGTAIYTLTTPKFTFTCSFVLIGRDDHLFLQKHDKMKMLL